LRSMHFRFAHNLNCFNPPPGHVLMHDHLATSTRLGEESG
jgi:hypothetical protein